MERMPCRITDGPDYDTWLDRQNRPDPEDDPRLDEKIAAQRETDLAHASNPTPRLHVKVGQYTGTKLYSYDQALWFSTPETALRAFNKRYNQDRNES